MPKAFFHVLELVLSHNSLTNLPNGMKNLEILDISYNKFEKLDFLTSSVNLKVLNACYNNFSNPELLLKKIKNCPLVEINLIGLSFSHKDVGNFFQAFQNLEKFNQKLISDENREAVFSDYSFDYKFDPGESEKLRKNDEIKQQPKKSLCLEIPDQSFLSKFSPNISVTSENKRNKFSYDKNLLSPETSVEFILPENKNLDRNNDKKSENKSDAKIMIDSENKLLNKYNKEFKKSENKTDIVSTLVDNNNLENAILNENCSLGAIKITVFYDVVKNLLSVTIHEARNLKNIYKKTLIQPYVRVFLLPDDKKKSLKRRTKLFKVRLKK